MDIYRALKWPLMIKVQFETVARINDLSQTSILSVWIRTLYDQLTVNFPKHTTNALRIFDMETYVAARFAAS